MVIKIVSFRISKVAIPLAKPFVTALRRVEAVEAAAIELYDVSALCGIGEAPGSFAVTGETLESIVRTIEKKIMPLLLYRDFLSLQEALEVLFGCCEGSGSAKAAVDMALHDLWSKRVGIDSIPYLAAEEVELATDVTISLDRPEVMAMDARKAVQCGYDILKVKVGGGDGLDILRVEAVREAAPSAKVLVDANQAWSEEEAMRVIEAISPFGIELVEQPVLADEMEGMRRITKSSEIPILADESIFMLDDAVRVIEGGCADMVNVKVMKCGGLFKAAEILSWCEENRIGCMIGSMLESPRSIAAAMRLAGRYDSVVRYIDLDSPLLYEKLPESAPMTIWKNRLKLKSRQVKRSLPPIRL